MASAPPPPPPPTATPTPTPTPTPTSKQKLKRSVSSRRTKALSTRWELPHSGRGVPAQHAESFDLPMHDQVKLRTTLWRPLLDGPRPTVLMRSAYFRKMVDTTVIADMLCARGCNILLQDVRGRFKSEGVFSMSDNRDADDALATLEWLAQQPWQDGRVAFCGISMSGFTAWGAAAGFLRGRAAKTLDLELCALVPTVSSSDIFKSGMMLDPRPGQLDVPLFLDLSTRYIDLMHGLQRHRRTKFLGSQTMGTAIAFAGAPSRQVRGGFKRAQKHLPLGTIEFAVTSLHPGDLSNFEVDVHPDPTDPFWAPFDHSWAVDAIGSGAVFKGSPSLTLTSGFWDICCRTTVRDYVRATAAAKAAGASGNQNVTLTLGPWSHLSARSAELYFDFAIATTVRAIEEAFGLIERKARPAPVAVFVVGSQGWEYPLKHLIMNHARPLKGHTSYQNLNHPSWRFYSAWPPVEAVPVELHLCTGGRLVHGDRGLLGETSGREDFTYDPIRDPTPTVGGCMFHPTNSGPLPQAKLESRKDVLVFSTDVLEEDVEITGEVEAFVKVASSAASMDVFCRLCDVDSKGVSRNLVDGLTRVTLKPGEEWPLLARVEVGPIAARFRAGHRIRLQVSSGSFPYISRNLGFGDPTKTATRATAAVQKVFVGPHSGTRVVLPVIEGMGVQQGARGGRPSGGSGAVTAV